jgi:hypothetical protein
MDLRGKSMAMRCSNCGGQVVVPNVAAPFFSCSYCHATLPNPAYQHAVLSVPAAPASGGKLKYALAGGLLVLLGAGVGPVAMSLLAAPVSSAAAAATSTAPNGARATSDSLAPAVAVPVLGNVAAAQKVEGKLGAAPAHAGVPAAAALAQPPTAVPVAAAAVAPLTPSHPTMPPQTMPNVGGTSASSSTASTATAAAVSTVPKNVHVSMGSPSIVSGTYSIDAIRRVLSQASGGVRACYAKGFVDRPTMVQQGGALPVSFQIQPDGTVRGAGVSGFVDVPSNTVSCINRTIGGLQFPPTEGWTKVKTTVTLSASW